METIVNAALPVLAGMVIGYALAWFLAINRCNFQSNPGAAAGHQ